MLIFINSGIYKLYKRNRVLLILFFLFPGPNMKLRSATSVLLTLVYCTAAENNVPRWSKPDQDLGQGEWVPVNSERLNRESPRLASAISPQQFNRPFEQSPSRIQYQGEYQTKQIQASQNVAPRIAFLQPQSVNPQPLLQRQIPTQPLIQQQIPSEQLLSQFLNQQIEQSSLPIFSRALLQNPPPLSNNYYPQPDNFNLQQNYDQVQDFKNGQYNFNGNSDFPSGYAGQEKPQDEAEESTPNTSQPSYTNEQMNTNLTSDDSKKKEEVQILYVPVEMLRQQEKNRNFAKRPTESRIQSHENQNDNTKESKKFRHPIQPLKDQFPAYHLRGSVAPGKLLQPLADDDKADDQTEIKRPSFKSQRTTPPPRNDYVPKYYTKTPPPAPVSKEQYSDESTIQDEISDFRNTVTRRTPQRETTPRHETTLPPPNQPPLSVFMESTSNSRIGDVLGLLKDSKTIPVLDSVGPDTPQVFVGPSNLNTPQGYIKYELPYLSSLNANNVGPKALAQVPFFVAPLNFHPPPGYAKIPFPPPHIGSVVLSNVSTQNINEDVGVPTPPSVEHHTVNYKETFTIPADISSISPQLPSLINSLQEDEYAGASSTESLTEVTEEPKYRRPTSSRRQNNRGSQRGFTSTTTRRPSSRQRKPTTRYYNQRINQNEESKETPSTVQQEYVDDTYLNYNSNRRPATSSSPIEPSSAEPQTGGNYYSNNGDNEKQEQRTLSQTQGHGHFSNDFVNNPSLLTYSNDDTSQTKQVGLEPAYQQGRVQNFNQHNTRIHQDTRAADALQHATNTPSGEYHSPLSQTENANYNPNHSSIRPTNSFDAPVYQDNRQVQSQVKDSQDISRPASGYDELPFRQNIDQDNTNNQDFAKQRVNYSTQDQYSGVEATDHIPLKPADQTQYTSGERYSQPSNEPSGDKQSVSDYRPHISQSNFPQTTVQGNDYHDQTNNYENTPEPTTRTTEKPTTPRGRSRVRGRLHHQLQQSSPTHSNSYDEQSHRVRPINHSTKSNGDSYDDRHSDPTTEQPPASPSRKFLHSRGRRPLRPTLTTTTTTTTTAPPGTKYLIRTRRPTVAPTKIQAGRGRIRRPTTPTTTTEAAPATEYPRTLPYHVRQHPPEEEEPTSKYPLNNQPQDQVEYRGSPQYQDGRSSVVILKNQQNQRDEYYQQPRFHEHTNEDRQRKVHNYSYEAEDENYQSQKSFEPPALTYSSNFERTPKPHSSREYETTTQPHYAREYERTLKPHYTREYETTPKPHYTREYETTQKPHYMRDYETTPKAHYTREYDATQKPHHSRVYETTPKAFQVGDFETTRKPHLSREYETTQKPQYYEETVKPQVLQNYEPIQTDQNSRDFEQANVSQQYDDYEPTTKTPYVKDYSTTQKSHYRGPPAQSNQDFETTQKPQYSNHKYDGTHKTHGSRGNTHHSRRRPTTVNRGETQSPKYNELESTTKKNTNSDFWDQAVTIQQSQSYVYSPDGNLSPTEEGTNQGVSSKPAQPDYDDYYNFQEGGHYSSDQSPFPSNDQHVTLTRVKPHQEIGKADQYPGKASYGNSPSELVFENNQEKDKFIDDASINENVDSIPAIENAGDEEKDSKLLVPEEEVVQPTISSMEGQLSSTSEQIQKETKTQKRVGIATISNADL